jgi:hypothetical protein
MWLRGPSAEVVDKGEVEDCCCGKESSLRRSGESGLEAVV